MSIITENVEMLIALKLIPLFPERHPDFNTVLNSEPVRMVEYGKSSVIIIFILALRSAGDLECGPTT